MNPKEIIPKLPYTEPFLFVDEIVSVSENKIEGRYRFKNDEFFYRGHFKDKPVTPGVILAECMAQIGLVCLGVYLLGQIKGKKPKIVMASTKVDFYKSVFPGEQVSVFSEKIYFRFNKLKCVVKMYNPKEEMVCKGEISGMIKPR